MTTALPSLRGPIPPAPIPPASASRIATGAIREPAPHVPARIWRPDPSFCKRVLVRREDPFLKPHGDKPRAFKNTLRNYSNKVCVQSPRRTEVCHELLLLSLRNKPALGRALLLELWNSRDCDSAHSGPSSRSAHGGSSNRRCLCRSRSLQWLGRISDTRDHSRRFFHERRSRRSGLYCRLDRNPRRTDYACSRHVSSAPAPQRLVIRLRGLFEQLGFGETVIVSSI